MMPTRLKKFGVILLTAMLCITLGPAAGVVSPAQGDEELRPKHVTVAQQRAVQLGLDYLARTQNADGGWTGARDGAAYPVTMTALAGMAFLANGNTPTRGPYAENIRKATEYLLRCGTSNGLITGPGQEQGRPMYGHGFALMYLSTVYGMETNPRILTKLKKVIADGVQLTATGQSNLGGWTYFPGGGDEGSVTVTQIQALRAAHANGFTVPQGTVKEAITYLERCKTPEGGIRYSFASGPQAAPAISAAAVATLYNAGDYESPLAESCLSYVTKMFDRNRNQWAKGTGHEFYTHLYASQAFYQAGDKAWDNYFPTAAAQLVSMQDRTTGSWEGDGIGPVYGTAIALTILQLPYKFIPIYQR